MISTLNKNHALILFPEGFQSSAPRVVAGAQTLSPNTITDFFTTSRQTIAI
ncbi:MAG: hypothetical protein WBA93_01170 [Microcoleaceae cyanobacterium]